MSDIVEKAKTWIGTPFKHQGRDKYIGADCAGLIIGVGEETGSMKLDDIEKKILKRYRRFPAPSEVLNLLKRFFNQVEDGGQKIGDVALIKSRDSRSGHLGIITQLEPFLIIIHANDNLGKIVEQGIPLRSASRVAGYFRYRGL